MNLGKSLLLHLHSQLPQQIFIAVNIVIIKICRAGNSPDIPTINVFQRESTRSWRFPVSLDGQNSPFHRVVPRLQLPDLPMELLIFPGKNIFDQGNIFFLQNLTDLCQTHSQLFHVDNHVQTGVLIDVIVPVTGLRIGIAGFQQPFFIIQPQGRNGNSVQSGHFADR